MLLQNINRLSRKINIQWFLPVTSHMSGNKCPMSPAKGGAPKSVGGSSGGLKRAEKSGKCRMCFVPEEWFTFFHVKTGVSGFYVFMLTVGNYCLSKEIFVMEHEYYVGLSWIVILYLVVTKAGAKIGASLDKQVDAEVAEWEKGRKDDRAFYEGIIKDSQDAQKRAEGQKFLMDAKKENIAMQLEAIYRERAMMVYKTVRGRMDYHVKRYYTEARVQQKWMIEWILSNVMKSITPEFQQRALQQAIQDLEAIAGKQ